MRRSVARSSSYKDTNKDDFPTVPWATRAFFEYVAPELTLNKKLSIYDPACGRGHILWACKSLGFRFLRGSDIVKRSVVSGLRLGDYENIGTFDYLKLGRGLPPYEMIMTNPPGKLATVFVEQMLQHARRYVAALCPLQFAEGGREHNRSRWELIYRQNPPTRIAVISARMPAAHGQIVQHRPVFRAHAWFYWDKAASVKRTEFRWIPPEAQRLLERKEDYR